MFLLTACISFFIGISLALNTSLPSYLYVLFLLPWALKTKLSHPSYQLYPFTILFISSFVTLIHINTHTFVAPRHPITKIQGVIHNIPQIKNHTLQTEFLVTKLHDQFVYPFLIKLVWPNFPKEIAFRVGDEWLLSSKLRSFNDRKTSPFLNYNHWAKSHHLLTTACVLPTSDYQFITSHYFKFFLQTQRAFISEQIHRAIPTGYANFISALSVGLREGITSREWEILQSTGTNHLIAIAGLHIGFLVYFISFLMKLLWKCHPYFSSRVPLPIATAWVCFLSSFLYSALAGFSLPTLRALIMLSIFLLSTLLRRYYSLFTSFSIAFISILLVNPFYVWEDSFWLSFGSVFLILYATQGRLNHAHFFQSIKLQWVLSIGLIPFTILFFHQCNGISFISNMVAIPVVGWLVLPLCFLGMLSIPIASVSHQFFCLANFVFSKLWLALSFFSHYSSLKWQLCLPDSYFMITSVFIGFFILLSPKGMPGKFTSIFWCLPLFINYHPISNGHFRLSALSLEKGQSILIQTPHHQLLFDTGSYPRENFNPSKEIIFPFLKQQKLSSLDMLVTSTNDPHYFGGTQDLVNLIPITYFVSINPELFSSTSTIRCPSSLHWQWDGVDFRFLTPPTLDTPFSTCLLVIHSHAHDVLLSGPLSTQDLSMLSSQSLPNSFTLVTPLISQDHRSFLRFIQSHDIEMLIFSGKGFKKDHEPPFLTIKNTHDLGNVIIDY